MLSRFVLVNVWVAWALTARTVGIGVIPGRCVDRQTESWGIYGEGSKATG